MRCNQYPAICLICLILFGCGCVTPSKDVGTNTAGANPTAPVRIQAGDNSEVLTKIEQRIKQVQESITNQNFALDDERAKLEAKRMRVEEKRYLSIAGLMVGFLMIALCTDSIVTGYWRGVVFTVAVSMIVGAVALPYLVPF
jgi:hypothetical protein